MSEIKLDLVLRDALIAALEQEWAPVLAQSEAVTVSHRQRHRFRKMLENPRFYYRRYTHTKSDLSSEATPAVISIGTLRRHKNQLRHVLIAALTTAVLIGSALAYSLSGGQFFTNLFHSIGSHLGLDSSYMNTEQLPELSGGSIGAVIETEEFRFEIMDIITDGYSAIVSLRVTDLRSNTVEHDGNLPQFTAMQSPLMDDWGCNMGHSISLDTELGPLEENQFFCTLIFAGDTLIPAGTYTADFMEYGYFDKESGDFVPVYAGNWEISFDLPDGSKSSRSIAIHKAYVLDGCEYQLLDARVSPLQIVLNFARPNEDASSKPIFDAIREHTAILLEDGTALGDGWMSTAVGGSNRPGEEDVIRVTMELNGPLKAEEIVGVEFGTYSVDLMG